MRRSRVVAALVPLVAAVLVAPAATAVADPVPSAGRPAGWTTMPTAPLSGDTSQEVFRQVAVVPGGAAFATGWTRHDLPGVSEVRTLVERFDGGTWEAMVTPDVETAPAADYLWGISGSSATDVWAVGRSATAPGRPTAVPLALHWDGMSWSKVPVPDPSGGAGADMSAVVSLGPDDVWAVGTAYPLEAHGAAYHWDGRAWSAARLPRLAGCKDTNFTELLAITATPAGEVYAGGDCPTPSGYSGFVARMTGLRAWDVVARVPGRSAVAGMTSDAAGTVWVTGTRSADTWTRPYLLSGAGTTWTVRYRPLTTDGTTEQAAGVAVTPTGVTIVGERDTSRGQRAPFGATWRPDGTWQRLDIPAPSDTAWLVAIGGSATGPVWAMGQYLGDRARIVGFAARPA